MFIELALNEIAVDLALPELNLRRTSTQRHIDRSPLRLFDAVHFRPQLITEELSAICRRRKSRPDRLRQLRA